MKQTTSILIPFKKFSKKAAIKYSTASHQEQEDLQELNLYPKLKDPFNVSRRSSAKPSALDGLNVQKQGSSSSPRKSSIKKLQQRASVKKQQQVQDNGKTKQSVRFSNVAQVMVNGAPAASEKVKDRANSVQGNGNNINIIEVSSSSSNESAEEIKKDRSGSAKKNTNQRKESDRHFYEIEEEPASKEQTITDQSQSMTDDMEFDEDASSDKSSSQNSERRFERRKTLFGQGLGIKAKAPQQQVDLTTLLEMVKNQQDQLLARITEEQEKESSSSHYSSTSSLQSNVINIYEVLGIDKNQIVMKDDQLQNIVTIKSSSQESITHLKQQELRSNQSSGKQFMGLPQVEFPSLISEQTNEEDGNSSNHESQKIDRLKLKSSIVTNGQQSYSQQLQSIKELNEEIENMNKNSSHSQLLTQIQPPSNQKLQELDIQKLQDAFVLHQQKNDRLLYEERKKEKLLIQQNQKLIGQLKQYTIENQDLKDKVDRALLYMQDFKNKLKAKDVEIGQFNDRYLHLKNKYSDLKSQIDDILRKKVQDIQNTKKPKDLTTENDFLQNQLQTLQSELMAHKRVKDGLEQYIQKVQYYESIIEDLTLENTRLIVKHSKFNDIIREKDQVKEILDKFKAVNKKLMDESEDYKHKFEVSDKLRKQLKEFFQKYVEKQLDHNRKQDYDNILISQSFIEKQLQNSVADAAINYNETINFDDKSFDLFNQTYDKQKYQNTHSYSQFDTSPIESNVSSPLKQAQQLYGLFNTQSTSSGRLGGATVQQDKKVPSYNYQIYKNMKDIIRVEEDEDNDSMNNMQETVPVFSFKLS